MSLPLTIVVLLQLAASSPFLPVRSAVSAPASPSTYHARNGATDVHMPAPDTATVVIDGILDEPVWRSAQLLTGFSLYQPVDQRAAPDSTEVLVWYSTTAIYFGVRAFEPHGVVRATLADRDRVSNDDNIELHLDTFAERRRAFVFIVNPLGIQADGTKSEGGGFIPGSNVMPGQNDLSPDFQWQSRGHVTDWGYEVEIRIPFSSLRFPAAEKQRWGVQFSRKVQHSGYEETWTPVRRGAASFIAQEGWLSGMTGLTHGVDVTLNPELTNTVVGAPCCGTALTGWSYDSKPRLGGNIRAGVGSNFVLNGTVRPDFSQVEADATQVAADPRFALFYAERRPFFVEGSDQFNVPNTLVYTRRIVQPDAALKLTGRLGRSNISLLSALDAPLTGSSDGRALVDVLRLTRDFSEQSQTGLVYSERVSKGRVNRLAGVDVRHVFGRLYYAQAQFAGTVSRTLGVQSTGALWEAVLDRTGRAFGFHYNVIGIRPDFRADNGFVARTGYVQSSFSNRLALFGTPGRLVERYTVFASTSALWQYRDFFSARSVLEGKASLSNTVTLRGGWSLGITPSVNSYTFDPTAFSTLAFDNGALAPSPFVPTRKLTAVNGSLSASTPQFRKFAASVGLTSARDVDFLETSRVRRTAYNASLDLRPTSRLRVNATYASNEFVRQLDGGSSFSTRIPRLKVEYQLMRPLFVRVISQYEANRREALRDYRNGRLLLVRQPDGSFAASTVRRSNLLRTDWLISFRPRLGTVFFAGYGGTMTEPDALAFTSLRRVSDGFFVKASWLFSRALQ